MTIQRINAGRGHWYKIDGRKVDGVTTLIKDGLPKRALPYWSARTVAEYVADNLDQVAGMGDMGRASIVAALKEIPWTRRDQAAAKGTEVHNLAEQLAAGHEVEVPEHLAGYVESCVRFLDEYDVRATRLEAPVGSRTWRYAGTADLIADVRLPDGRREQAVLDYKTGASGIWPDVTLQLAAYRNAEVYLDDGGVEQDLARLGLSETAYAVWLRADGYDVYPVQVGEPAFKTFQHLAWVARRTNDKTGVMKTWLGEALPAVSKETARA